MKKLHILGLALAAVFAFAAMTASSAFALESAWLVNGALPGAAVATDSEGELLLEDTKGGVFLEDAGIICKGTDEGTVGPGAADTLTGITVTECVQELNCPPPVNAKPINLPWNTSIELIGTEFYDDLTTTAGTKVVGYTSSCFGVSDECTLALGRVLLKNGAGGEVKAEFLAGDANQPKGNCTRGGAGTGNVEGTDLILTVSGLPLAVSEE